MRVGAYRKFVGHVRKDYPKATIFLALGSMMSDQWPKDRKALSTARKYIQRAMTELNQAGDEKVFFVEFAPQDGGKNGLGSDWHPSLKTHQVMAKTLEEAIGKRLGWSAEKAGELK